MRTAFGKLALLAFAVLAGILLLAPMRAGVEDALTVSVDAASLNPGETLALSYELVAETAQTVTYTSDDPSVAQVDQQGLVTAMDPGTTTIHLRAQGGATARVRVEVSGTPVTSFELNTKLLELEKGEVSGLSCVFNDGATDQRVEWLSADPSVVTVDGDGRVTAVGSGETYVIATTPNGLSAAATVRVHVRSTAAQIVPGDVTLGTGATLSLRVSYLPEDATDSVVEWTSNQPRVLSVDEEGAIRAISAGTAVVTATTADGLTAMTTITVEPAASDFQINPTQLTIERGQTHALEAWFIGADGQPDESLDHHVEWASSNPAVATVADGVVTAVSSGTAVITASADGFQSACSVRVETNVQSVALNMTELYLLREQTDSPFQLSATVTPADADDTRLTYSTDNPLVATVTSDGLVTLTGGYGTATITATAASGAEASFSVHVVTELPQSQGADSASVETDVDAAQ